MSKLVRVRLSRYLCSGVTLVLLLLPGPWAISSSTVYASAHPPSLSMAIQGLLLGDNASLRLCGVQPDELHGFYAERGFAPVWYADGRLSSDAMRLRAHVEAAAQHGLNPADYNLAWLQERWDSAIVEDQAFLDLLLTDAFFQYATHLGSGRYDPRNLDSSWHIKRPRVPVRDLLRSIVDGTGVGSVLASLAPTHQGYRRLQKILSHYQALAAAGQWPVVPAGTLLRPGDQDFRVPVLRKRLIRSGDHVQAGSIADAQHYDATLVEAVLRFQRRHGLADDGIVGSDTLAALNVSLDQRIEQIQLNLERWRWLPRDLGERYLMVNMAGFTLEAMEGNETALRMHVIIGKPYRSTPAFHEDISYLVFNPYWHVPPSIARKDLLPRQQADEHYLRRHNIRVFSDWSATARELDPATIDWQRMQPRKLGYKLRQDPGPGNSLGRVKFMLPNRFNVYLHDTPARHLFEHSVRTFSSGCIRVEEPMALARYLLTPQALPGAGLDELIASGETRSLHLSRPVPVYLVYFTAWGNEDGIEFRNDVYGRDQRMAAARRALDGG